MRCSSRRSRESRTTFLNNLAKGQVRKGVVSSIVNFGAFVDLGGVDGLVHVSELVWKHIEHASEVVEVGQEVTVEILEVDLERERVSLSLKATQEDPWQVFARTHAIGQVAPGKVTKLVPFGAFVRVADGIEGLVHISELSGKHVELAEQVVSVGDEVFVKVIDIDLERRRISLSLKQANEGVDPEGTEFDPALYGMLTEYDDQGNYKYPEGFDPETNEWNEGFETQREKWEQDYAAAQARWEAHKKQVAAAALEEERQRGARRRIHLLERRGAGGAARSPTTRHSPHFARSCPATPKKPRQTNGRSLRGPAVRRSGTEALAVRVLELASPSTGPPQQRNEPIARPPMRRTPASGEHGEDAQDDAADVFGGAHDRSRCCRRVAALSTGLATVLMT